VARRGIEMFRTVKVPILGRRGKHELLHGDDASVYEIFRHGGGQS